MGSGRRHTRPHDNESPDENTTDKKEGRLSFRVLKPYFSLLRGQELKFAAAILLMLGSTTVTLAIPVFAGRFVDALAGSLPQALSGRYLLYLALLLIVQLLGSLFFAVISARLGMRTITRLRQRLFAHLLELPSLYFSRQKAGDLSSRTTSDVGSIQYLMTTGLINLTRAIVTLIGALVLMVNLNSKLTVVVLLMIPATIGLTRLFGHRLQKLSRKMYDELGRISSHVQETVGAIRSIKVYNNQNYESTRFSHMLHTYEKAGIKRAWLSAALESGIQISLWVCLIAVIVYGFYMVGQEQTTGGELVAFLLLAFRVAMPLASLTGLFSSAQGAVAAASRLDDIFHMPAEREPGQPLPKINHEPASIRLENVEFSYEDKQPDGRQDLVVLQDVNLEIKAGQWIGIVGPSGAGKTTLAGLLMGLFPPAKGALYLDDRPYTDYELSDLRAHMAYVAQEPTLNDESLAENIRFGLEEATESDIQQAADQAGVSGFAGEQPDGMDTRCGERGLLLSGGQRQRVALARAFLRDPGILILDEPTSALDAASEEHVVQALRELMKGRTAIVIAHRLSLVRDLDQIFVLADGKLAEQGTHQELLAKGEIYNNLYNLQFGPDTKY